MPLKYPYVDSDDYLVLADNHNLKETSFYVKPGTNEIIANGRYGDYPYYTDGVVDGPSACVKREYCNAPKTISIETEVDDYTATWCIK